LPRPELDALAEHESILSGTQTDVMRSAVGLAVRAGAHRPDISAVGAFKRALLAAQSVGYSDGPSGAYVVDLLQRLGIAREMEPKIRLTSGPVAELVAKGGAEIGLQQIVAILPVRGADLVGPLPAELQNIIVYAAGLSARSANGQMARRFIAFMATPQVAAIIRAKGMEPG
jgi:molybdate transport system substrate-binding protein